MKSHFPYRRGVRPSIVMWFVVALILATGFAWGQDSKPLTGQYVGDISKEDEPDKICFYELPSGYIVLFAIDKTEQCPATITLPTNVINTGEN